MKVAFYFDLWPRLGVQDTDSAHIHQYDKSELARRYRFVVDFPDIDQPDMVDPVVELGEVEAVKVEP